MGLFHFFGRNGGKILRGATYAVQFMCFAHVFNQYVAEATFVSMPLCADSVTKQLWSLVYGTFDASQL